MFHPFEEDLSKLSDMELEDKIRDLNKKIVTASRLGKPELLTQIEIFVTIYKQEMSKRYREKTNQQLDGDLDQLINVD
jgi:hypothetical protein